DRFLDAKYFVVTVRTVKDACFMTIKPSISKQFTISYIISVVPLHGEVATICTRSDMIAPQSECRWTSLRDNRRLSVFLLNKSAWPYMAQPRGSPQLFSSLLLRAGQKVILCQMRGAVY
ncbi:MAG TPA: hypothetical protein VHJ19_06160, partial [Gammaproteobacteria bacterium]|nr:hypothetical protein [Gammaproteobacteria bacterium]